MLLFLCTLANRLQKMNTNTNQEDIPLFDITEHPTVWRWMLELFKQDNEAFFRLTEDNTKRFSRILGKAKKIQDNKHCWIENKLGILIKIQTSKIDGTRFFIATHLAKEQYTQNKIIAIAVIQFLTTIKEKLLGTE